MLQDVTGAYQAYIQRKIYLLRLEFGSWLRPRAVSRLRARFAREKIIKSLRSARRAPSFARNKNCFFRSRLNIYPYFSADFRLTTFKNTQKCATKSLSLEPSSVLSPISHQATTGISYLLEKHASYLSYLLEKHASRAERL